MKTDYGNYQKVYDYPEDIRDFAKRRVGGLLTKWIVSRNPLSVIVESAYLQGLMDATKTHYAPKEEEAKE
jgi:hypothetical protein